MVQICLKCLYFNIYDTDTTFHVQITFVVQNTYMWNVLYDKTKWKKNCKREKNVKQRLTFALLSDFLQLKGFFLWFLDCSWRVYVTYFKLSILQKNENWKRGVKGRASGRESEEVEANSVMVIQSISVKFVN